MNYGFLYHQQWPAWCCETDETGSRGNPEVKQHWVCLDTSWQGDFPGIKSWGQLRNSILHENMLPSTLLSPSNKYVDPFLKFPNTGEIKKPVINRNRGAQKPEGYFRCHSPGSVKLQ